MIYIYKYDYTELVYTKKGGLKIQHSITEQHLQFYTVVASQYTMVKTRQNDTYKTCKI